MDVRTMVNSFRRNVLPHEEGMYNIGMKLGNYSFPPSKKYFEIFLDQKSSDFLDEVEALSSMFQLELILEELTNMKLSYPNVSKLYEGLLFLQETQKEFEEERKIEMRDIKRCKGIPMVIAIEKKEKTDLDTLEPMDIKIPCLKQCCFEFVKEERFKEHGLNLLNLQELHYFFGSNSGIKRNLYFDYSMVNSFGGFNNLTMRTVEDTLTSTLSDLNDYTLALPRKGDNDAYPLCLYEEMKYLMEETKELVRRRDFGRKEVDIEHLFRVDRTIINYKKGIVRYVLHGLITEKFNGDYYSFNDGIRRSIKTIEVEREYEKKSVKKKKKKNRKKYLRLIREKGRFDEVINVGIGITEMNDDFIRYVENFSKVSRFDELNFGGRFRLIVVLNQQCFNDGLEGISSSNVKKMLKRNGISSYKIVSSQQCEENEENRLLSKMEVNQLVLDNVNDPNEIVLLMDFSYVLPLDFFYRVRSFVVLGERVFVPVCFKINKGKVLKNDNKETNKETWFVLHDEGNWYYLNNENKPSSSNGWWKKYFIGMVAAFRSDFAIIGDCELSEIDLEMEGINFLNDDPHFDIVERFVFHDYSIFQSAEMNCFEPDN